MLISLKANSVKIYHINLGVIHEDIFNKSNAALFIAINQNPLKNCVGFNVRRTGE